MRKKTIGRKNAGGGHIYSGVGYVTVPADLDRAAYIKKCFDTSTVSILNDEGNFMHRVKVGRADLQLLDFPEDEAGLGSGVMWVNVKGHNKPVIVCVLERSDTFSGLDEHTFQLKKRMGNSLVSVRGNARSGVLNLSVTGGELAELNVRVAGKKESKVTVHTNGSLNAFAGEQVQLQVGKDTKVTANQKEVQVVAEKVSHNAGKEAMLRGNETVKLLKKFIGLMASATTTTGIGQMPLMNALEIRKLEADLNALLSEKSFLE